MTDALPLPEPPAPDDGGEDLAAPVATDTPPDDKTCGKCGRSFKRPSARMSHERTCKGIVDDPPAKRGPGRPPKPKLNDKIEGMIGGVGLAVSAFNLYDGQAIIAGAADLADALDKWAEENPAVRSTLMKLVEATTAGAVVLATVKIAIPIAANHGLVPADMAQLAGVPAPRPTADAAANGSGPS